VTDGAPYLRIVADVRAAIASGELRAGDRLPSLNELAAEYGVAQPTASKAVRAIVAEGLAEGRPGVGVFVRAWRPINRVVPTRLARSGWGAGRAIQDSDTDGRSRVAWVTVERVPAPAAIADLLGVDEGAPVVARARRFDIDGRPVQLATAWIPADLAELAGLTERDTGPGGMWARLADVGHAPTGPAAEEWELRPATPDELERLQLPAAARVLEGIRVVRDASGRAVDASVMVLAEGAYRLIFAFDL
jgi:GntR family transcriptional regulator